MYTKSRVSMIAYLERRRVKTSEASAHSKDLEVSGDIASMSSECQGLGDEHMDLKSVGADLTQRKREQMSQHMYTHVDQKVTGKSSLYMHCDSEYETGRGEQRSPSPLTRTSARPRG